MRAKLAGVLVSVLGLAGTAQAGGIGGGAVAGTLGLGVEASYAVSERFSTRGVLGFLDVGFDIDARDSNNNPNDDLTYDGDLELRNAAAFVDFHPFKGMFRVSSGVIFNDNGISATAACNNPSGCEFGDSGGRIARGEQVTVSADYNDVGPYVGIGWGSTPQGSGGWSLTADLGVMYFGDASVSIDEPASCSSNPSCRSEVDEEERELEEDADNIRVYPVAMIGVSYRF